MSTPKVIVTEWHAKRVSRKYAMKCKRGVVSACKMLAAEVKKTLGTPGDPRSPSKEGESPHRITGELQNAVGSKVRQTQYGAEGTVFVNHPGASRLNYGFEGTDASGKRVSQGPRPFFETAISKNKKKAVSIIKKALK